jgi:hypothetical protein
VAVRWFLRYGLSYRDTEELPAERGVEVDHVTVYRWVQRFIPLLADAARSARHSAGDRRFVDERYGPHWGRCGVHRTRPSDLIPVPAGRNVSTDPAMHRSRPRHADAAARCNDGHAAAPSTVDRVDVLGGLIHECRRAA